MGRCIAHVLLAPLPAPGHCIPFISLAPRLVHLGVRVTFLMAEGLIPRLREDPLFANRASPLRGKNIEVVAVKDGFSKLEGRLRFFTILQLSSEPQLVAAYSDTVAVLMTSGASPAPCCIISDMLMGWTQEVAAKFHIPSFILHSQSAANLSLMLHVPTLIAEGRLPLTASNQEMPVHIPGLKIPLATSELPSDVHPGSVLPNSAEIFLRTSWRVKQAPIVLINTFRELEDDVFEALHILHADATTQMPKVIPVGPLLPSTLFSMSSETQETSNEVDASIMRFLDKHPPQSVVYVAFGSVPLPNQEKLFEEAALGLEASGQPFLWANPTARAPNATSLARSLPQGFVERTKERGMVVNKCVQQVRILQHSATGAFLSHCGWNSVIESIAAGVPILASPLRSEQKMNARFMVDIAKVAVELKRGDEKPTFIPRSEVERAVRLVTQEEAGKLLRSRAEALKVSAVANAESLEALKSFLALCGGHDSGVATGEAQFEQ